VADRLEKQRLSLVRPLRFPYFIIRIRARVNFYVTTTLAVEIDVDVHFCTFPERARFSYDLLEVEFISYISLNHVGNESYVFYPAMINRAIRNAHDTVCVRIYV